MEHDWTDQYSWKEVRRLRRLLLLRVCMKLLRSYTPEQSSSYAMLERRGTPFSSPRRPTPLPPAYSWYFRLISSMRLSMSAVP